MAIEKLTLDTLQMPLPKIVGQEFLICGVLKANYAASHIEVEQNDRHFNLQIVDSTLLERMGRSVPGWVGGSYVYSDPVQLVGVLGEEAGQPCVITVRSGVLSREDEGEYDF